MSEVVTMETWPGTHIRDAIKEAVALAEEGQPVQFAFNAEIYRVEPGEGYEEARDRIGKESGFEIRTAEEDAAAARERLEKMRREQEEAIAAASAPTEEEMRDAKVPWPKSEPELTEYIRSLVDRPHDYGTCVYAMSMAAVAAFYYVSHKLGVTGAQAGFADMDILRRTRHMEHGFRLVNYADMLYPQYWDDERAPIYRAALRDNGQAIRDAARSNLKESPGAHPEVVKHWESLASGETA